MSNPTQVFVEKSSRLVARTLSSWSKGSKANPGPLDCQLGSSPSSTPASDSADTFRLALTRALNRDSKYTYIADKALLTYPITLQVEATNSSNSLVSRRLKYLSSMIWQRPTICIHYKSKEGGDKPIQYHLTIMKISFPFIWRFGAQLSIISSFIH